MSPARMFEFHVPPSFPAEGAVSTCLCKQTTCVHHIIEIAAEIEVLPRDEPEQMRNLIVFLQPREIKRAF